MTLFVPTRLLLTGLLQPSPSHWITAHGKTVAESVGLFAVLPANHSLAAAVERQRKHVLVADIAVETVAGMAVGKVETAVGMAVGSGVEMVAGKAAGKVAGKGVGLAGKEVRNLAPVQMCSELGVVAAAEDLSYASDLAVAL